MFTLGTTLALIAALVVTLVAAEIVIDLIEQRNRNAFSSQQRPSTSHGGDESIGQPTT